MAEVVKSVTTRSFRSMSRLATCTAVAALLFGCTAPNEHPAKVSAATDKAAVAGTPARVRLMTADQYANMIADVFGTDIKPGKPVPPMTRTDGLLEVGAASVGVTVGQLMQLQRSAAAVASQVVDNGNLERQIPSHRDFLVPCKPKDEKAADDVCAEKFIRSTGRLLFRRPLAGDKVASDPNAPVRGLVARHVLVRGRLWERNKGRILVVDQVEPLDQEP